MAGHCARYCISACDLNYGKRIINICCRKIWKFVYPAGGITRHSSFLTCIGRYFGAARSTLRKPGIIRKQYLSLIESPFFYKLNCIYRPNYLNIFRQVCESIYNTYQGYLKFKFTKHGYQINIEKHSGDNQGPDCTWGASDHQCKYVVFSKVTFNFYYQLITRMNVTVSE